MNSATAVSREEIVTSFLNDKHILDVPSPVYIICPAASLLRFIGNTTRLSFFPNGDSFLNRFMVLGWTVSVEVTVEHYIIVNTWVLNC